MNGRRRVPGISSVALLALAVTASPGQGQLAWEHRFADVDGGRLFYRTAGSGPYLLMLHGMTGVGEEWDRYAEELASHFTVVVPDLLGHGRSRNDTGVFELPHVARTVVQLTDRAGMERFAAVGFSIGAVTLLHMATEVPERIAAMVLVAGGHRVSAERRAELRTVPGFEKLPRADREWYLEFHPGGEDQVRALIAQRRALADNYIDFSEAELGEIDVPSLLMWGENDEAFPLPIAFELQQALPRADLWLLDGQGHNLLWPEWGGSDMAESVFSELVIAFLERSGWVG